MKLGIEMEAAKLFAWNMNVQHPRNYSSNLHPQPRRSIPALQITGALVISAIFSLSAQPGISTASGAVQTTGQTIPATSDKSADDNWRRASRKANIAFGDGDYAKAELAYKAAILALEKQDPYSEAMLDLNLNLADTYRRKGDLSKAMEMLNEVSDEILSQKCSDPLLPARYWRRRASVLFDLHDAKGYAAAYANAIKIAGANLPEEYRAVVNDKLLFLGNLTLMGMWDVAAPLCRDLRKTSPASADEATRINAALDKARTAAIKDIDIKIFLRDESSARELLKLVAEIDTNKSRVICLANNWLARRTVPKPTDYQFASELLQCAVTPNHPKGLATAPKAADESLLPVNLMLAKLAYLQGKPEAARLHENAARSVAFSRDEYTCKLLTDYCEFCFDRAAPRIYKEQMTPPTEQLMRAACDFQPVGVTITGSAKNNPNQGLNEIALYKLNLARVLNTLNRPEEAATVIDSIPEKALALQDGKYWYRYGRISTWLARNQGLHGKKDEAMKRFEHVLQIAKRTKDPKTEQLLKEHVETCKRGIE